jgi:aldose 1-epimerase
VPAPAQPQFAGARREPFGALADGTPIEAITLANGNGITARILTYGATLQALAGPDRHGASADVILGHDEVGGYERTRAFLGVTVGRYANRIAGGQFTIDGTTFQLSCNDGANVLHGGDPGFDQAVWRVESIQDGAQALVTLSHASPDGEGGFPGEVRAKVTYSLGAGGDLAIIMTATTTRPTIVAMTNHAVFDLATRVEHAGALQHRLTIPASAFTPIDTDFIPTGEIRPVAGTPFDFRQGRIIAEVLRDGRDPQIAIGGGYDHNFVLDKGATLTPELAAVLEDPVSGRRLEVLTTEPGLQFYSGNAYDGRNCGKAGRLYVKGDGIALEPQKFPNTPNQPAFGSARLDPGQTYCHSMIYRLSARQQVG